MLTNSVRTHAEKLVTNSVRIHTDNCQLTSARINLFLILTGVRRPQLSIKIQPECGKIANNIQ